MKLRRAAGSSATSKATDVSVAAISNRMHKQGSANERGVGKGGMPSMFHAGHARPALPECGRWTKAVVNHMKMLIVCSILVSLAAVALGQGILLNEGQSYVFDFSSIPDLGPAVSGGPGKVIAWFAPGTMGVGENALMEIFPDSLSDSPRSTRGVFIDEFPSGRTGLPYWWSTIGPHAQPPFFPDLQGIVRVTMFNGTAQLSGFEIAEVINGEFYSGYFAVPEPPVGTLFAVALVCSPFLRRRVRPIGPETD